MLHFWLSVFIKGFWDSVDFVGQSKNGIIFAILVLVITVVWLRRQHGWHGWKDAIAHWYRTVGEGILIALVAWLVVLTVHLVYEPYHLQDDMSARRNAAQSELQGKMHYLAECDSDLKAERVKGGLLESNTTTQQSLINSQQTMLNAQQGTLAAQQNTLNSQQTTTNNCVIALGQANMPTPQKFTFVMDAISPLDTKWKHNAEIIGLSNQTVALRGMLECENEIGAASVRVAGAGPMIGTIRKLDTTHWLMSYPSPAAGPLAPVVFVVSYNEDDIGACNFVK
jgi:hypothetical protein